MRVISLVPSLTETLIACDVEVVGRTRFCIHPEETVQSIPVVGGTKGVNWNTCAALEPDLVILDQEENTREMADTCPFPWLSTHITSVNNVGEELDKLAGELDNDELINHAKGWKVIAQTEDMDFPGWENLPGVMSTLTPVHPAIDRAEYIIWRKPWMGIGPDTFIHSVLVKIGIGDFLPAHDAPYPELADEDMYRNDTCYLFSSEPFPFARYENELRSSGQMGMIVDGEFFSWFGIRSYRLLSQYLFQKR